MNNAEIADQPGIEGQPSQSGALQVVQRKSTTMLELQLSGKLTQVPEIARYHGKYMETYL